MNTIAERIRFAMNVRNVKQVEMVQRTGITKGAFSSYLSGNYNPKKDKLELIADALDININWLMGENAPMENSSATDNQTTGYVFYKEMEYLLNNTDTAGANLEGRTDVVQGALEHSHRLLVGLLLDHIERGVDDVFGDRLLAVKQNLVDELRHHGGTVDRIGQHDVLLGRSLT